MNKKNKRPKPSGGDIGGIPPTFTATTFASSSDKDLSYNNSKRKAMIQARRKSVRQKRGNT